MYRMKHQTFYFLQSLFARLQYGRRPLFSSCYQASSPISIVIILVLGVFLFVIDGFSSFSAVEAKSPPTSEALLEESDKATEETSELSLFESIPVVVTASKRPERISKAASIISVITEEDIEQMGARTIMEVLRTIPGVEIIQDLSYISQIVVRGFRSETSSGVKILIDGHSLNDPLSGGATWFYDDLPLKNVRRIEIIRGPASAIYGANAFVSVVNIITKSAYDIDGIDISIGGSNFQTINPSFLFGKILNELEVTLYADYYTTDGADLFFKEDALSTYDRYTALDEIEPISLAPREFRDAREKIDLAYTLRYRGFSLRGRFMNKHREPFLPYFNDLAALNDTSEEDLRHAYTEMEYRRFLTERLEFSTKGYVDYFQVDTREQFAQGLTLFDTGGQILGQYPNGLITKVYAQAYRIGLEEQINLRLLKNNDLTLGAAYEYWKIYNASLLTNSASLDLGYPPDKLLNIEDIDPDIDLSESRTIISIFAQDTWKIRNTLDLTLGLRGDFFSDMGGVFTPKAGMVYQATPSLNLKALFGSAFRLSSFLESVDYESDQDTTEELRTFEIGASYQPLEWLLAEMNYFYTDINELIQVTEGEDTGSYPIETTRIYQNIGGIDVHGVEFELQGTSEKEIGLGIIPRIMHTSFRLNYSYQDARDAETHQKVPNIARHKANLGIGFKLSAEKRPDDRMNTLGIFRTFSDVFSLYFNLLLCGERERSVDDVRDSLSGYHVLDMTLTTHDLFHKGVNLSFSIKNMLNKKYYDPSPELSAKTWQTTIPGDFPYPGRTYVLELRYTF
ncbi:putative outer membrane protein [Candidatus Vecturithrix granuli]|uniref:Putative outer membrane protein n=1 Tax=Vecturithrix granuli TaxID=1499967 RepID=A0A0S6WAB1_VECG1|nr:putative outer membrane protein [Candidatus Vecturithrix granuli]